MIKRFHYFLIAIYLVFAQTACTEKPSNANTGFVQSQPFERETINGAVKIVSRAAWTNEAPNFFDIDPMGKPYRITIHHTAIDIDSSQQRDEKIGLLRIIDIHKHKKGWADIGYHYLIGTSGTIYEARSMRYQGAHARGANNIGNIGIAVMGDYEANLPPKVQVESMKKLVRYLQNKYRISNNQIHGHIHFTGTKCPGKNMMPILKELQSEN